MYSSIEENISPCFTNESSPCFTNESSPGFTNCIVLSPVHVLQMSPVQVLQVQSSPGFTTCLFIQQFIQIKQFDWFLCVRCLTIRLRARDFYEVIVDEGEARINYHFIEIESECSIISDQT